MAYGEIKVDTVTFTDGGIDKSVSISGLVQNPTFSGNITVTGTISGNVVQGQTVSGTTVTGTTAQFTSGTFISLTGTTTQGTTATYTSGGFTSLTGVTTSGTTANFVSGVFSTQISGATVTGNAGSFTTLTGGTTTITSGVFALGTASLPSISFASDPNTGIYSPDADQLALATAGTGRLFIDSSGRVGIGTSSPSTPLAIQSDNGDFSATYNDFNGVSLFISNNGTGGVGTLSGGIVFDSPQRSTSKHAAIVPVQTGADTNQVGLSFWVHPSSTRQTDLSEAVRIDSSGRVGIGTTSPDELCQVEGGNFRVSGTRTAGSFLGIVPNNTGSNGVRFVVSYYGSGSYGPLEFWTGGSESARIDSSGRLLVGTSTARSNISPLGAGSVAFNLQHEGTSASTGLAMTRNSADAGGSYFILGKTRGTAVNQNTLVANNDGVGAVSFCAADGTSLIPAALIAASVDGTPGTNDMPGRLVFSTTADGASSPTERMRIDSLGRVGIGTSSPQARLDILHNVNNSVYFRGGIGPETNRQLIIGTELNDASQNNHRHVINANSDVGELLFKTNSTNALFISNSQSVGIGTTSPASTLHVNGDVTITDKIIHSGDTDTAIRFPANDTVSIETAGTERMRIDSSGRVGIGTTQTAGSHPLTVRTTSGNGLVFTKGVTGGYWNNEFVSIGIQNNSLDSNNKSEIRFGVPADGTSDLRFITQASSNNATEKARIDPQGRLLVGTSSAQGTSLIQVEGVLADATSAGSIFLRRGLTIAQIGVNAGTLLGNINFGNKDGGIGAWIRGESDATWGSASDTPGRLVFSTTADGESIPTERMRIDSSGNVGIGTQSPTSTYGGLDISSGGISLVLGADNDATTRTDSVTKVSRIGSAHYTNAEQPVAGLVIGSTSTDNFVSVGGGTDALNAATVVRFYTAANTTTTTGSERARIDSSGRLLVGTSSSRANFFGSSTIQPSIQVETLSSTTGRISAIANTSDTNPGGLILGKTRATSLGGNTIVQANDWLGFIQFMGADGTNVVQGAAILAAVDGTPGANDMPGRLVFSTTADGASSPTERMRIDSSGRVGIGTTSPASTLDVNGDVTITDKIIHSGDTNTAIRFPANDTVSIETAGTERMRIDSSGRVGIGTSSPGERLEIGNSAEPINGNSTNGQVERIGRLKFGTTNVFGNRGPTASIDHVIRTDNWSLQQFSSQIAFSTAQYTGGTLTQTAVITHQGYFGVGTTTPSAGIHVNAPASNSPAIFAINNSEAARIDSSGRLLVGTSTGQYRLTVNTNLTTASGEKHFLIQTGNHVQVKRDFDTSADTSLVVLNAGAAGNSTQGAWEITIFGVGFKSGVSDDRQHYQKWYVSRNNAGTFLITSAFSSGTSGMFTLTSSGNELRVRNAFSVVASGNIVVDITGLQGHHAGIAETDWMANVTMP